MRLFLSKRSLSLLVPLLLLLGASSALSYDVRNINIIAFPNETLEYQLTIINNETVNRHVYINKIFIDNTFTGRTINIEPAVTLDLIPGASEIVNISIPVSEELARGIYRTLYRTSLFISYANKTDSILLDAVIMSKAVEPIEVQNITLIGPDSVNPLTSFNYTVTLLSNRASINPVINVLVSNESSIIYESSAVKNLSLGINVFDKVIKLPDKTIPGSYHVVVSAELADEVVAQGTTDLLVEPYVMLNRSSVIQEDLFGKSVFKSVVNLGTQPVNVSLNHTALLFEPLLVTKSLITIIHDDSVINSQRVSLIDYVIAETVLLEPGQAAVLEAHFSYGLLLLIPFIIIVSFIGWLVLTRRVRVQKEIISCKREGDEIVVKVGIGVRNVSMKSVHEVKIVEDLPLFAKKAGGFGSIKGDIDRKRGVINFWVGRLDPKEEVLISYKFKTDVELLGRVSLPPVTVKYRTKDRKLRVVKSSTPAIHLIKGGQ